MPGPIPPDATDAEIIIWQPRLVATMLDLLDKAIAANMLLHRWNVAPWRRESLSRELRALLDRERDGWIIAEVPAALVEETRALRVEAYRRLGERDGRA